MNRTIKATLMALVCVTALGTAASAKAGTINAGALAFNAVEAKLDTTTGIGSGEFKVWNVHRRGRRHHRRHGRGWGWGGGPWLPLWALALNNRRSAPPPPPAPPAWRWDGYRWVCDYYAYNGSPMCR